MIYTVTMNPSLDYIVQLETFEEGKLNRWWKGNQCFHCLETSRQN